MYEIRDVNDLLDRIHTYIHVCERKPSKMRILFLDIDECAISFPCQNNGTCVNNNGSYVCECTEGYMGRHCNEGNPL